MRQSSKVNIHHFPNLPPFNCSVDFFSATLTSAFFTFGYE